jgi:hypothetical protein
MAPSGLTFVSLINELGFHKDSKDFKQLKSSVDLYLGRNLDLLRASDNELALAAQLFLARGAAQDFFRSSNVAGGVRVGRQLVWENENDHAKIVKNITEIMKLKQRIALDYHHGKFVNFENECPGCRDCDERKASLDRDKRIPGSAANTVPLGMSFLLANMIEARSDGSTAEASRKRNMTDDEQDSDYNESNRNQRRCQPSRLRSIKRSESNDDLGNMLTTAQSSIPASEVSSSCGQLAQACTPSLTLAGKTWIFESSDQQVLTMKALIDWQSEKIKGSLIANLAGDEENQLEQQLQYVKDLKSLIGQHGGKLPW